MKEGWTSLHKTIREINLVFKGLTTVILTLKVLRIPIVYIWGKNSLDLCMYFGPCNRISIEVAFFCPFCHA